MGHEGPFPSNSSLLQNQWTKNQKDQDCIQIYTPNIHYIHILKADIQIQGSKIRAKKADMQVYMLIYNVYTARTQRQRGAIYS